MIIKQIFEFNVSDDELDELASELTNDSIDEVSRICDFIDNCDYDCYYDESYDIFVDHLYNLINEKKCN